MMGVSKKFSSDHMAIAVKHLDLCAIPKSAYFVPFLHPFLDMKAVEIR
jgi:hypothetical protein